MVRLYVEKNDQQKQKTKNRKKEEHRANSSGGELENMMAYVDEIGRITHTQPDPGMPAASSAPDSQAEPAAWG